MLTMKQKLQQTIDQETYKIHHTILTSAAVADRIEHPYFHSQPSVPEALTLFKQKIAIYREQSHTRIQQLSTHPFLPTIPPLFGSLATGTFAHECVGSLVVASFGVGECSECAIKLTVKLIQEGFRHVAFIKLSFDQAQAGKERGHIFIVANLPELPPQPIAEKVSYRDFFKSLPSSAIVADPFLELTFNPNEIPEKFTSYIAAYDGEASVSSCTHLKNWSPKSPILAKYIATANQISGALQQTVSPILDNLALATDRLPVAATQLTSLLQRKTGLPFFSVRDANYKVDAIVEYE